MNGVENTRTVLVPMAFGAASLAAFEAALVLHAHPGTTVVVLHVIDEAAIDFAVGLGYGMRRDVSAKARTHAETTLRRLTDVEAPEGVEIQRVVSIGHPVVEIVRLATELAADLVVIGAPVATTAEHAVFGSTAARVLRAVRCPVLVIPGPRGDVVATEPVADEPSGAPSTT